MFMPMPQGFGIEYGKGKTDPNPIHNREGRPDAIHMVTRSRQFKMY